MALLLYLRPIGGSVGDIEQGVYVEAWGTLFDIIFVVLLIGWFELRRERKQHIERYSEEIDDYKRWDTEEARVRIAGNLRRLSKLGVTAFDLRGITLRDFSFFQNRITKLRGTVFNTNSISGLANFGTVLDNVDFSATDCVGVVFSKGMLGGTLFGIKGTNLRFLQTNLVNATFDGATLEWTDFKPNEDDWFEVIDDDPQNRAQVYAPPFEDAELAGASFRNANLLNADFRYAKGLEFVNFSGTKGLETCFFDEGVREKLNTLVHVVVDSTPPVVVTAVPKESKG
ncbi:MULTISPECIES: pentapeptide repeat-containing protein [unclassified Mesorhizobium]|uniref:pentapeptide repeat-containing protein n=1 Tax=unclassified Mesorhizobium TaxID=325217 RepID=UPI00333595D2